MRPQYLVGIIIGSLLIYLSFYGLAGFGFSFTGGNQLPQHEDFNDMVNWQLYYAGGGVRGTINPAGELELQAGPGAGDTRSSATNTIPATACGGVSQYTVTAKIKGNWTVANGMLAIGFRAQDNSGYWEFWINGTYIYTISEGSTAPWIMPVTQDANYHVYTFCVTISSNQASIDVYRDTALVKSGSAGTTSTVWQAQISLDSWNSALVHVDYVYFDAGLHPPTQQTATLTVSANYLSGGNYLPLDGVTVTANSVQKTTPNAVYNSLVPGSVSVSVPPSLPSGGNTYTFSVWQDGIATPDRSVNVQVPSTSVTATYTLNAPPPTTGSLKIWATYQGTTYVAVAMTISGPTPTSGTTTTDPNNPLLVSNLQAGSYTVSGTYNSIQGSNTVQVVAGTTAQVTVNFAVAQPTTGNLTIVAYYQGSLVVASVSITGPQSSSGSTSTDSNHPLVFPSLTSGTYHVTGTFTGSSGPQTADPVVSAGQNSYVTLTFQSITPPVDIIGQLIAWLRTQLDKPIVREGELGIGGLLTLASIIGFFWPGKKPIYVMSAPR